MGATHPRAAVNGHSQRCTLGPLSIEFQRTRAHAPARFRLICKQGVVGSIPIVSTTTSATSGRPFAVGRLALLAVVVTLECLCLWVFYDVWANRRVRIGSSCGWLVDGDWWSRVLNPAR